ncbi:hypothetical protein MASR2M18_04430 [Ignavibacteria bacterium]|nr:hypothetical protein [Bacteroidota bacterium]MCZ2131587.1 carboxypeptidase-like regulatory domain-containing protein [Bacteroidota bacterium]
MKAFFLVILSLVVALVSCSIDDIPTKPNNSKVNGNGIITGMAYVAYYDGWFKYNNVDIQVSLLGTTITTKTDSMGRWTLRNVDSGTYIIRFTKAGPYDTSYAYRVYSNGIDSVYLKEVITDTMWVGVQKTGGDVRELPPNLSVSACTTFVKENIRMDTATIQGQLQHFYDTTYTWTGSFTIEVSAANSTLNDKIPVSFMCCLSEKAHLDTQDLPDRPFVTTSRNQQIEYWSREIERVPPGEQPIRIFNFDKIEITPLIKRAGLKKGSDNKLYYHIIPICEALTRTHDEQWGTPNVIKRQNIMGQPYSFEVQWQ